MARKLVKVKPGSLTGLSKDEVEYLLKELNKIAPDDRYCIQKIPMMPVSHETIQALAKQIEENGKRLGALEKRLDNLHNWLRKHVAGSSL